jgi:cytochrome c5
MLKPTFYSVVLLATLAACGNKQEAPAPSAEPAPVAAAAAVTGDAGKGEHVYKGTCVMCHGTGAGGAPKFGDKTDWAPRIAQGKPALYEHALKGFNGSKGVMPAKGANTSLPDDDVKAAVDYMVSQVK